MNTESEQESRGPQWAAFAAMGLSLAACVGVGVVLGIWLDSVFHTSPALLFVGLVLGCAAAGLSLVAQVRRFL